MRIETAHDARVSAAVEPSSYLSLLEGAQKLALDAAQSVDLAGAVLADAVARRAVEVSLGLEVVERLAMAGEHEERRRILDEAGADASWLNGFALGMGARIWAMPGRGPRPMPAGGFGPPRGNGDGHHPGGSTGGSGGSGAPQPSFTQWETHHPPYDGSINFTFVALDAGMTSQPTRLPPLPNGDTIEADPAGGRVGHLAILGHTSSAWDFSSSSGSVDRLASVGILWTMPETGFVQLEITGSTSLAQYDENVTAGLGSSFYNAINSLTLDVVPDGQPFTSAARDASIASSETLFSVPSGLSTQPAAATNFVQALECSTAFNGGTRVWILAGTETFLGASSNTDIFTGDAQFLWTFDQIRVRVRY